MTDLNLQQIDETLDEEFIKFYNLKRSLMSYFDIDKILNFIVKVVNEDEHISFSSARSAKFITKENPIFKLVMDLDKILELYYPNNPKKISDIKLSNDLERFKTQVVYDRIIYKTTGFMFEQLVQLRETNNTDLNEILKEIPSEDKLKEIVLFTVFKILVEEGNTMFPIINIEYFY